MAGFFLKIEYLFQKNGNALFQIKWLIQIVRKVADVVDKTMFFFFNSAENGHTIS